MKQGILLAGFGTGDAEAKKTCLDAVTDDVRKAFPACVVAEAWTSSFLRRKMKKFGINMLSAGEALELLLLEGCDRVVVQPTHLIDGIDFCDKLSPEIEKYRNKGIFVELARPVLSATCPADFYDKMDMLFPLDELEHDEELVMMGHGSPNTENQAYVWMQEAADDMGLPVHIGVLADWHHPNKYEVVERLQEKKVKEVYLRSLLLSGGYHAHCDMAGDSADSWQNYIKSSGIAVRWNTCGLGGKASYRRLYIKSIEKML